MQCGSERKGPPRPNTLEEVLVDGVEGCLKGVLIARAPRRSASGLMVPYLSHLKP